MTTLKDVLPKQLLTSEERRLHKVATDKKYYLANKDKNRLKQKRYRERNPNRIKDSQKRYYKDNKEKVLEYHRRYREAHRAKLREKELLRRYGVDYDKREQFFISQGGKCAICGKKVKLVVDHKHDGTKNIRGLLCSRCNVGLGMFGDNSVTLQSAIRYLKEIT